MSESKEKTQATEREPEIVTIPIHLRTFPDLATATDEEIEEFLADMPYDEEERDKIRKAYVREREWLAGDQA